MMNRENWVPKIGELVRIRDWDDMKDEFGTDGYGNIMCEDTFTEDMRGYCGYEFVIKSIDWTSIGGHGLEYSISLDMIEPVEIPDFELKDDELVSFIENFS